MIEPFPIIEAPVEALLYVLFFGLVHAAILAAGLVLATPLFRYGWKQYLIFARAFVVFNVCLLVTSAIMNAIWSCTIWGRVYFSTDYVADFNPFYPIGQAYIESSFGDMKGRILSGFSIGYVRAAWFAFAFAAWVGTALLYSGIRRLWTRMTSNR